MLRNLPFELRSSAHSATVDSVEDVYRALGLVINFGDYRLGKHGIGRVVLKGADDMGILAKSDSGVARASTGSR
ncbi:MAG: hypothetical protein Q4G65_07060 [bacterium]|nr:hypothetical protein [bacterium]